MWWQMPIISRILLLYLSIISLLTVHVCLYNSVVDFSLRCCYILAYTALRKTITISLFVWNASDKFSPTCINIASSHGCMKCTSFSRFLVVSIACYLLVHYHLEWFGSIFSVWFVNTPVSLFGNRFRTTPSCGVAVSMHTRSYVHSTLMKTTVQIDDIT